MKPFRYERAADIPAACASAVRPSAKFIAGGTNLVDLMKEDVERPTRLIDISRLPLTKVEETPDGVLLKAAPLFPPTRYEDVYGSLQYKGKPKTLEEMEAGIANEVRRRHARGRY